MGLKERGDILSRNDLQEKMRRWRTEENVNKEDTEIAEGRGRWEEKQGNEQGYVEKRGLRVGKLETMKAGT